MKNSKDYKDGVYSITRPDSALPLIFDSPHSGRIYPETFDYACDPAILRRGEDSYVDELFETVPQTGGTLLCALFPRTYIDTNRALTDIDEALLDEPWPGDIEPTRLSHAGIGLVRRLARPGIPVYDRFLGATEIQDRIDNYYTPYHDALAALLDESHYNFGHVWHINCHSMPVFKQLRPSLPIQPDFVIGDRDGTSSEKDFVDALRDGLEEMGYRVFINNPYKGVEIVRRSADPARGRHSIQLEINKGLYWNEDKGIKSKNYKALKSDIEKLLTLAASYVATRLPMDIAAD